MKTRTALFGILIALAAFYVVSAVGSAATCFVAARGDPWLILTNGKESAWSYCIVLHLFFPFTYLP
jgi:hypothetical protein